MRVAISGKGGVGKTAVSSMLARAVARSGRSVLAFDFDVNPGLEVSVGELDRNPRLSPEAVAPREGADYGHGLREGLSPTEAALAYGATGPDGLRVLSFGSITVARHDLGATHLAVREIAAGFAADGWDVIVDMEAGTKDVFDRRYIAFVDVLALVTDGSPVANLTCRRLAGIAAAQGAPPVGLVANRATEARLAAVEALAADLGVAVLGAVPDDEAVRRADVAGQAVADHAPDADALHATDLLAAALRSHCADPSPSEPRPSAEPAPTVGNVGG